MFVTFATLPALLMLVWGVTRAFQADSIRALLFAAIGTVAFGAMAVIPWVIGWAIGLGSLLLLLGAVGLPDLAKSGVVFAVMGFGAVVGAVFGWRYLDAEVGTDARQWRL